MKTELQEGEDLLYRHERVGLAVYKSPPTMHAAGSVPGLHTIELWVTDRRVIIKGAVLGGVQVAEFDLWYPGRCSSDEYDVLERVSVGKSRLSGTYLHLTARAREHGPLRSDMAEMYLYVSDAERIALLLNDYLTVGPAEWR